MSEVDRWALVGPGMIGQEVQRQLGQGWVAERLGIETEPEFVVRSAGVMGPDGVSPNGHRAAFEDIEDLPDVTFLAIPSGDEVKGVAHNHISAVLEAGKIAVTAEKGALADDYDDMRTASDNFTRLGISATVGGGTRLVSQLEKYCVDKGNISQIHLALNGTLSAIFSSIAPPEGPGMSLGQAVHQAVQLGYAEPPKKGEKQNPYNVIKEEARGDIPKKTAILMNHLGLTDGFLKGSDLEFELGEEAVAQAIDEARVRRFIVSLYPKDRLSKAAPENDIVGGFQVERGDWEIVGGFRQIERNPLFHSLASLTGPGNGFVIGLGPDETDGVYSLTGPGAGVRPTVNTMLDDYISLKQALRTQRVEL